MTEDETTIVLARLEKLAGDNAVLQRRVKHYDQRLTLLDSIKVERDRLRRDLAKADDKIAEWLSHSEMMYRLVPKNRRKEIGPLPKPLETSIPF